MSDAELLLLRQRLDEAIQEGFRLLRDNTALRERLEQTESEAAAYLSALEAIRDYCENPAAVSAEGMTDAEKVGGMWSQAVAALQRAA